MITDKKIEDLRREAAKAGDMKQVRLCTIALQGGFNQDDLDGGRWVDVTPGERAAARKACETVIVYAEAMARS